MLILAIDTSGRQGSIALGHGQSDGVCEIVEVMNLEGGTFSAQLIPQAAALLAKHKFDKRAIGALVAASGPGSFTGLRVGLAAVKALGDALQKPIAMVSLLEAVARGADEQGKILAALDAGRGDIYAGEYEVNQRALMVSERLLTREEFLAEARGKRVVTSDAPVLEAAREAGFTVTEIPRPRADAIARLGWEKILRGETVSPEALEANYIRRSDAEIFSKPR
jgi:tRNA threonylcarbamoyladenosine biosynthesis protein TsaB